MRRRSHYYARERRPAWKQDTPDEQFVAVMQSVEGWVGNLERGISPKERCLEHIKRGLDELKALQAYMQSSWEAEPASEGNARGTDTSTEPAGDPGLGESEPP